ncbi:MAG: response regulator [Syntrophales bacterium]|nr:response regulator [Syntrophales bacterium]MDP3097630.1 response regulator [Syntrophales bacterium]
MSNRQKILIVDDEPRNLRLLEAILMPEGYEIDSAENGRKAVDKALSFAPDLILLDVMMPEMDGYQACKAIRGDKNIPYIPIIFLTAMEIDQKDIVHGLDMGGDDYIKKPFVAIELFSRIRAALRVKKLYDELARTKAELARYVSLSTLRMAERIAAGDLDTAEGVAYVTVLFSDIRGYTSITEHMEAAEVFKMLNACLSKQIEIVEKCQGIIDKLTGDEVMAVFHGEEAAQNALQCGREIVKALCNSDMCLKNDWIGVGIGVNTGPVYIGSIGSIKRQDYTVIGTTVNIAARLCGHAKKFQVLFTENTRKHIEGKGFSFMSIGNIPLKGISLPINVFELE